MCGNRKATRQDISQKVKTLTLFDLSHFGPKAILSNWFQSGLSRIKIKLLRLFIMRCVQPVSRLQAAFNDSALKDAIL